MPQKISVGSVSKVDKFKDKMVVGLRLIRCSKNCRGYVYRNIFSGARQYNKGWPTNYFKKIAANVCIATGIGVSALTLYTLTAECKQSPQTEEKESTADAMKVQQKQLSLEETIERARDIVQRAKDETGSPGLVVGVSINGKTVWAEGLGYADIENRIKMSPETVLRIASISKPITMAAVAKQWELGKLDLDKPVQFYVPSFPEKEINGVKVNITIRQLVSHMGGIRHYRKDYMKKNKETDEKANASKNTGQKTKNKVEEQLTEMELDEYFITKSFQSVTESLSLFKDDPLVHSPGSEFLYSTHAWTLISAILEAVAKEPFEKHIIKMAKELGMDHTYLDENSPLIYHRGRHYMKNKSGKKLINCPYVDLSYKWAGGGLLSTVTDLLQFGNVMLYSYQIPSSSSKQNSAKNSTVNQNNTVKPGFLKPETVKSVWAPLYKYGKKDDFFYGMGWFVNEENQKYGQGKQTKFCVSHTGNAVGGSSVLLILPPSSKAMDNPPKGVVVAIIVNMISVNLDPAARDVAELFENYYLGQDESA